MRRDLTLPSLPTLVGCLAALLVVAVPTYWDLAHVVWSTEEQSHGPVILCLAIWLAWRSREKLQHLTPRSKPVAAVALCLLAAMMYVIGRSQATVQLEVLGVILFIAAAFIMIYGLGMLRILWFPFLLLLFTVPLPGVFVQALTVPLKSAVSYVAEAALFHMGYPIARTGVIITIGQYQLLVADACAGLTSIFTLEAIGLVYLELMEYKSRARNIILAIMVVPCAFAANVIRVCILALITYHFGNDAGQGFAHNFAGIILFAVAVVAIVFVDRIISFLLSLKIIGPAVREKLS